ncbi:MAG: hypothetical protein IPK07_29400 [Deltaproteobacteria bacterium]|nr:hypothetical protein [Deltaproteobacteria bacterium]
MSPVEGYELLAGGPPLVPLAWNFVVPAFLGFLVGSTYVLTFGLIAAVVVWAGASVLFALWLVTGLYPFNRLALIGYAVGGALVLRAAGELLARAIRRGRGRVRIADLAERDRDWAGAEAIALMRLTRAGARVVPQIVVRGAPVVRADPAWSSAGRSFELLTRHPRGGPVCLARIEWLGGTRGADLDRVTARAIGPDAESAASELPLPACFALLDRAEAGGVGAARLFCGVTAEGSLEVSRCEPIARADWTDVWLAGAGSTSPGSGLAARAGDHRSRVGLGSAAPRARFPGRRAVHRAPALRVVRVRAGGRARDRRGARRRATTCANRPRCRCLATRSGAVRRRAGRSGQRSRAARPPRSRGSGEASVSGSAGADARVVGAGAAFAALDRGAGR